MGYNSLYENGPRRLLFLNTLSPDDRLDWEGLVGGALLYQWKGLCEFKSLHHSHSVFLPSAQASRCKLSATAPTVLNFCLLSCFMPLLS